MANSSIEAYWSKRWPNFKPEEVLSPDGLAQLAKGNMMFSPDVLDLAQAFRVYINMALFCNHAGLSNRGYRSPEENARIKGSGKFSRHVQGIALDLSCYGMALDKLFNAAKSFQWRGRGWTAIGIYTRKNFIHVDERMIFEGEKRIWIDDTP